MLQLGLAPREGGFGVNGSRVWAREYKRSRSPGKSPELVMPSVIQTLAHDRKGRGLCDYHLCCKSLQGLQKIQASTAKVSWETVVLSELRPHLLGSDSHAAHGHRGSWTHRKQSLSCLSVCPLCLQSGQRPPESSRYPRQK